MRYEELGTVKVSKSLGGGEDTMMPRYKNTVLRRHLSILPLPKGVHLYVIRVQVDD
jgi:hypothetical protein